MIDTGYRGLKKGMCAALLALIIPMTQNVLGQTTYSRVYNIFQSNCASCHGGFNPAGQLDLASDTLSVYTSLIDISPTNAAAAAKGHKLIDPGYPHRSYLLRLFNNGLDAQNDVDPAESSAAHDTLAPLAVEDVELIRQWVLHGAPDTSEVVDVQVISRFYNGFGMVGISQPTPPDPADGFQIHLGPIFLDTLDEREYFKKHKVFNSEDKDVTRMDGFLNGQSHHFALYKYYPNADTNEFFTEGLRLVDEILDAAGLFYNAEVIAQWQYNRSIDLPAGTAFYWEQNSVLDFNYHLLNGSQDSVLAAEVYINVYYQPHDNSMQEMLSLPVFYGGDDPSGLTINPTGQDSTFVMSQFYPDTNEIWNIWILQSHTHQYGVDYDIFLRNSDGTKGQQVYEGDFNTDYTFNQGFYEWQHPAVHEFDPLLAVDMENDGLIHEATYNNFSGNIVNFGLTNNDEMFVTYMHFTKSSLIGVDEDGLEDRALVKIYPNPFSESARISISDDIEVMGGTLKVYDLLGKEILLIDELQSGDIVIDGSQFKPGVYFYQLFIPGGLDNSETRTGLAGKFIVH